MISFLLKGILRDKSRSVLPVIIVALGVALTVFLSGYLRGVMDDITDQNARFETGHVKVLTRAYAENQDQMPLDLGILGVDSLIQVLHRRYPKMIWVKRIRFGGIMDVPDVQRNSRGQGPALGIALDFLSAQASDPRRMNVAGALVRGRLPKASGELLIGNAFAEKLQITPGDTITYFGTTMNGSMAFENFRVCGTVHFGMAALDKGTVMMDVSDAQKMLDMMDGAGEVLGFSADEVYQDEDMQVMARDFNARQNPSDTFAPVMFTLKQQHNLGELIDYSSRMSGLFVFIFVIAMAVVLWNTGLLGGLRRYREFGIRLALGENKSAIYWSLVVEAAIIGVIGTLLGMLIGLSGVYYLQRYGIDISGMMDQSAMLIPSVIRGKVTPDLFFIGFIPGLIATTLGAMLSGMGIFKRQTATLFKELEV